MIRLRFKRLFCLTIALVLLCVSALGAYQTLRVGDKGQDVLAMQNALIELGYQITADGAFGKNTRAAVIAFQKDHSLKADGLAGNQTLTLLYSLAGTPPGGSGGGGGSSVGSDTLGPGSTGEAVIRLQQMLQLLGYDLATDGQYGQSTSSAVRQFQADYGLRVDGIAGADTQLLLSQMVRPPGSKRPRAAR